MATDSTGPSLVFELLTTRLYDGIGLQSVAPYEATWLPIRLIR